MIPRWKLLITAALFAVRLRQASAQAPEVVTLELERENTVAYVYDLADPSRFATSANMVNANLRNFMPFIGVADIVSVNGKPARGSWVTRGQFIMLGPSPTPGQAIGDIARGSVSVQYLEILQSDGTPVGTIMISGFPSGLTPPGLPPGSVWNLAVTGGTGAFLGARGTFVTGAPFTFRAASIEEDPANRRTNGGPSGRFIVYLIPMSRPAIVSIVGGPAVVHASDSIPVTTAKPAKSGEVLTLYATGLGPTQPALEPGKVFTANPLQLANSPIEVTVAGQPAQVLYAGGYPGSADGFQVNFRLPSGATPGMARLQVTAAFVPGQAVSIPIQ